MTFVELISNPKFWVTVLVVAILVIVWIMWDIWNAFNFVAGLIKQRLEAKQKIQLVLDEINRLQLEKLQLEIEKLKQESKQ